jgi:hypothetical protein
MATSEFATGAGLEIGLEGHRLVPRTKRNAGFNAPRPALRSVRAGPAIVVAKAVVQIVRDADIVTGRVLKADENIDVLEDTLSWHAKP